MIKRIRIYVFLGTIIEVAFLASMAIYVLLLPGTSFNIAAALILLFLMLVVAAFGIVFLGILRK